MCGNCKGKKGQWNFWTLDPRQQVGHAYVGRGWRPFAGACVPLIPVSVSKGIQRAWRQPKEVRPLHILDALLHGLAISRVNRNKPKLNLFWLFIGLFRETKKHFFRFVSVFRTDSETTETNRTLSKQTEKTPKNILY